MKKNTHLVLFICFCFTVHFSVSAQIKIPGVQQQPQWAMPFMFEDANGDRDTVWIGYDPDASSGMGGYDSIYNEYRLIDTSKFCVILCPNCLSPNLTYSIDSAWKVEILSNFISSSIGFINGKMPITMYWVDSLFYSDSLPFPDLFPAPNGKGIVTCDDLNPKFYNCPLEYEVLTLTDSVIPGMTYTYSDSIVFAGDTNWTPGQSLSLIIRIIPFNDFTYLGINGLKGKLKITVYPNPVQDRIYIENDETTEIECELYNIQGKKMMMFSLGPLERKTVYVDEFPSGIYLLKSVSGYQAFLHKILKP
jgi:type IX secretion system substrate protein